jgi:hypothetical protein
MQRCSLQVTAAGQPISVQLVKFASPATDLMPKSASSRHRICGTFYLNNSNHQGMKTMPENHSARFAQRTAASGGSVQIMYMKSSAHESAWPPRLKEAQTKVEKAEFRVLSSSCKLRLMACRLRSFLLVVRSRSDREESMDDMSLQAMRGC